MSQIYRILAAAALLVVMSGCSSGSRQAPPDLDLANLHEGSYPTQQYSAPTNQPASMAHAPAAVTNIPPVAPSAVAPDNTQKVIPPTVSERYSLDQTWVPLREWCLANNFSEPRRIPSAEGAAYSFNVPKGTVVIQTGSQMVNWCGVTLYLGWAPVLVGGHPSIAALDIRKNFEPLLGMAYTHRHGSVIVIDPGHGGMDTGTRNVSNNHAEKEFTLDWAMRLRPLLAAQGWTVYLTRTTDVNLKLPDRVAFADSVKADIFLSLHFNSAYPETKELGLETYCIPSRGMPSNLTRGSQDIVSLPLPNNVYDADNIQLAERLHRSILKINGHQDRGVRRARFLGVLKWQVRPAVLIEGGYLSNPAESRKIADPNYRQQLAEAVAAALKPEAELRQITVKPGSASATVASQSATNLAAGKP